MPSKVVFLPVACAFSSTTPVVSKSRDEPVFEWSQMASTDLPLGTNQ